MSRKSPVHRQSDSLGPELPPALRKLRRTEFRGGCMTLDGGDIRDAPTVSLPGQLIRLAYRYGRRRRPRPRPRRCLHPPLQRRRRRDSSGNARPGAGLRKRIMSLLFDRSRNPVANGPVEGVQVSVHVSVLGLEQHCVHLGLCRAGELGPAGWQGRWFGGPSQARPRDRPEHGNGQASGQDTLHQVGSFSHKLRQESQRRDGSVLEAAALREFAAFSA